MFSVLVVLSAILIFGLMLGSQGLGRHLRRRRASVSSEGVGVVDGAIFALLGLLIAFIFSGAAARFDERRRLCVVEANDVGTAALRMDLVSEPARAELKALLRRYVEARLDYYAHLEDRAYTEKWSGLQGELWGKAVQATRAEPQTTAGMLLLPALNSLFDTSTSRLAALWMHPPPAVALLLVGVAALSGLLAGYAMAGSSRFHEAIFAAAIGFSWYVMVEMEFPRRGLITVADFDFFLRQALANI